MPTAHGLIKGQTRKKLRSGVFLLIHLRLFFDAMLWRPGLNIPWDYAYIVMACFIDLYFPG